MERISHSRLFNFSLGSFSRVVLSARGTRWGCVSGEGACGPAFGSRPPCWRICAWPTGAPSPFQGCGEGGLPQQGQAEARRKQPPYQRHRGCRASLRRSPVSVQQFQRQGCPSGPGRGVPTLSLFQRRQLPSLSLRTSVTPSRVTCGLRGRLGGCTHSQVWGEEVRPSRGTGARSGQASGSSIWPGPGRAQGPRKAAPEQFPSGSP